MGNPLRPDTATLTKLGSIVVHVEESIEPDGHEFDIAAVETLLADPDVRGWLREMDGLALLPKKRSG